jgi:hypothetical protein
LLKRRGLTAQLPRLIQLATAEFSMQMTFRFVRVPRGLGPLRLRTDHAAVSPFAHAFAVPHQFYAEPWIVITCDLRRQGDVGGRLPRASSAASSV